ncbi:MAG: O-antigen ligase family protein [Patescibacteria group bacterium]|nr:O-antigen ligase family protein [Patescibacteria group bacterium]MDD5554389.1 O-antigen ligase family protein [Patescibacteria group bacterium]
MSQNTYLKILRWGIYLSFLSVLLTWKNFYFPYISTKQIYFNILTEILFVFWLALIIKYPSWRPKKNWISFGLLAFFTAMLLSCFGSTDFNLSFWGDIERMLGFFHLFHFLILYFIIITVMRSWPDWRDLFLAFIIFGFLVSLHGIAQRLEIIKSPWGPGRVIATIGNAAYVGAYAIFNLSFIFILFFKTRNRLLRAVLAAAAFIVLLALIFSGTRGAYLGFGASLLFMPFLLAILSKSKKARWYGLLFLFVLIISITGLVLNRDSAFVQNNSFLARLANISMSSSTMQTRFISWRAAARDFTSHPILGTGLGNYAIIFDKYFDPTFYNYTRSETYFDQAHNNLIDIASTTGLLGLFTYLSIFIAAFVYLIRGFKKREISSADFILLIGLIVAYFIQNLVVFDALVTYISLMVMLGYIYWLSRAKEPEEDEKENLPAFREKDRALENKEIYSLFVFGLIALILIYQFDLKPAKMLIGTINGQMALAKGDVIGAVEEYKNALSYNTVLDRDSRASLVKALGSMTVSEGGQEKAKEILDYGVELAKANVKYNPKDNLMQVELAQVLDNASRVNTDNSDKFYYYSDQALEAIDLAVASSPGRIPVYFTKAQIYLTRGETEKAIETLEYAVSLNEDYYESTCQLAKVYMALEREEEGYAEMDKCLDKGGAQMFSSSVFVKTVINHYIDKGDAERMLTLYAQLTRLEPKNVEIWVNLSKLYAQLGRKEEAVEAARKAALLDPGLEASVERFIRDLE